MKYSTNPRPPEVILSKYISFLEPVYNVTSVAIVKFSKRSLDTSNPIPAPPARISSSPAHKSPGRHARLEHVAQRMQHKRQKLRHLRQPKRQLDRDDQQSPTIQIEANKTIYATRSHRPLSSRSGFTKVHMASQILHL